VHDELGGDASRSVVNRDMYNKNNARGECQSRKEEEYQERKMFLRSNFEKKRKMT
jgi:hypothetical protein